MMRVVLSRAGLLGNNVDRVCCPESRKAGLPVTNLWVESRNKEINDRGKGTKKFWNEDGAESMVAVRAAMLSDDERLDKRPVA